MNNEYPVIPIPLGLSDEAAAALLELLDEIVQTIANHYAGQLHRHYQEIENRQPDLWDDVPVADPPFLNGFISNHIAGARQGILQAATESLLTRLRSPSRKQSPDRII